MDENRGKKSKIPTRQGISKNGKKKRIVQEVSTTTTITKSSTTGKSSKESNSEPKAVSTKHEEVVTTPPSRIPRLKSSSVDSGFSSTFESSFSVDEDNKSVVFESTENMADISSLSPVPISEVVIVDEFIPVDDSPKDEELVSDNYEIIVTDQIEATNSHHGLLVMSDEKKEFCTSPSDSEAAESFEVITVDNKVDRCRTSSVKQEVIILVNDQKMEFNDGDDQTYGENELVFEKTDTIVVETSKPETIDELEEVQEIENETKNVNETGIGNDDENEHKMFNEFHNVESAENLADVRENIVDEVVEVNNEETLRCNLDNDLGFQENESNVLDITHTEEVYELSDGTVNSDREGEYASLAGSNSPDEIKIEVQELTKNPEMKTQLENEYSDKTSEDVADENFQELNSPLSNMEFQINENEVQELAKNPEMKTQLENEYSDKTSEDVADENFQELNSPLSNVEFQINENEIEIGTPQVSNPDLIAQADVENSALIIEEDAGEDFDEKNSPLSDIEFEFVNKDEIVNDVELEFVKEITNENVVHEDSVEYECSLSTKDADLFSDSTECKHHTLPDDQEIININAIDEFEKDNLDFNDGDQSFLGIVDDEVVITEVQSIEPEPIEISVDVNDGPEVNKDAEPITENYSSLEESSTVAKSAVLPNIINPTIVPISKQHNYQIDISKPKSEAIESVDIKVKNSSTVNSTNLIRQPKSLIQGSKTEQILATSNMLKACLGHRPTIVDISHKSSYHDISRPSPTIQQVTNQNGDLLMATPEEVYDITILERMLQAAGHYEQRRRIRAQMRLLKKKQDADGSLHLTDDYRWQRVDDLVSSSLVSAHYGHSPCQQPTNKETLSVIMGDNSLVNGINLLSIHDELVLHEMLDKAEDYEDRKKIRARLKDVLAEQRAKREEIIRKREEDREESLRSRVRDADEQKRRTLAMYDAMAKSAPAGGNKVMDVNYLREGREGVPGSPSTVEPHKVDLIEEAIRQRQRDADDRKARVLAAYDSAAKSGPAGSARFIDFDNAKKAKHVSPREKFQRMDSSSSSSANGTTAVSFAKPAVSNVTRSPTAIKEMLLNWVKSKTKEYQNIKIENFSTTWNDGMAFCALIHHFYPDAFDYDSLDPKNRRHNFDLAFRVAEEKGDVAPLLEVDDMVMMKKPDWKCVFTYVQSLYRRFHNVD